MSISTNKNQDKKKAKSVNFWKNDGFFQGGKNYLKLEKANLPENTLFYVNQG